MGVKVPRWSTTPIGFRSMVNWRSRNVEACPPKKVATTSPTNPSSGTLAVIMMKPMRRTLVTYSCLATISILFMGLLLAGVGFLGAAAFRDHGDENLFQRH